jgi:type II secretory pathway pseudopilin PulG
MRKRAAFTLVEMLVSMALILFIMVILSQAFTTGLQVFRQLKGLGDMEERLRSTSQILRRDLAAYHFENYRKLSDPTFWTTGGPPQQGFFRIWQSQSITSVPPAVTSLINEGKDGDNILSTRATTHILHFTSKLSGQGQGDFVTSSLPPSVAALVSAGQDGRYNPTIGTSSYRGRWFEVAYFLRPVGITTGASGVPLYALYRRQRGIIDNPAPIQNTALNPGFPFSLFSEIACQTPSGTSVTFWRPDDLAFPARRFAMSPAAPNSGSGSATAQLVGVPVDSFTDPVKGTIVVPSYPFLGEPGAPAAWQDNSALQGADLLLTDVISFEVKVFVPGSTFTDFGDLFSGIAGTNLNPLFYNATTNKTGPMVFDTWAGRDDGTYNFTGWNTITPASQTTVPLPVNISALKITIRLWDAKTQQARQLSIIQDM